MLVSLYPLQHLLFSDKKKIDILLSVKWPGFFFSFPLLGSVLFVALRIFAEARGLLSSCTAEVQ